MNPLETLLEFLQTFLGAKVEKLLTKSHIEFSHSVLMCIYCIPISDGIELLPTITTRYTLLFGCHLELINL
jgi:hypothetical protein